MKCKTLKLNKECSFMSKNGCNFLGGFCKPVVDTCDGCKNIEVFNTIVYCKSYLDPLAKLNSGGCGLATHHVKKIEEKKLLNPIKASKKASKKKKK